MKLTSQQKIETYLFREKFTGLSIGKTPPPGKILRSTDKQIKIVGEATISALVKELEMLMKLVGKYAP